MSTYHTIVRQSPYADPEDVCILEFPVWCPVDLRQNLLSQQIGIEGVAK